MRAMKSSAILTLAAFAMAPLCAAAATGPRVVTPEIEVALEPVIRGDSVTHRFAVRNEGDAELLIERVTTSCGCTVTEFDRVIAPGAEGTIEAVIDTTSLSGESITNIKATTNDPEQPELYLAVKLTVEEYVLVAPGRGRWNTVQGEQEATATQLVWARDGEPFEVTAVEAEVPGLEVAFRPATEDEREPMEGSQWFVDLTIDSFAPVGVIAGEVFIRTTHPKQKVTWVPVTGFVRPVASATPPIASWGEIDLSSPTAFDILVVNFATEPMELTQIETDLLGTRGEVIPLQEGRRFKVRIHLEPPMPSGPFRGKVTIHTNNPNLPELTVPVSGTVG